MNRINAKIMRDKCHENTSLVYFCCSQPQPALLSQQQSLQSLAKSWSSKKKNYSPLPNWLAKSPTYLQNYFNMTGTMKNILVRGQQLSLLLSKQHAKIGSRAIMSSASVRGLEIPSAKWVKEFWIQLFLKATLQAMNINIFFVILPSQSECYFILVKAGRDYASGFIL